MFVAAGASALQADTIFSNLGSTFDQESGLTVASGGTDYSSAYSFVVQNNSYQLTGIDFAAFLTATGGTNQITATIYSDNSGKPGTALYTTSPDTGLELLNSLEFTNVVTGGPILSEGNKYWLSLDAPTDSSVGWAYTDQANAFSTPDQFIDGVWEPIGSHVQGAFEIDGVVAAPEPVTSALLLSGIAGLVFARRSRLARGRK